MILRGIREVSWKSAKAMMAEANFLGALKKMDVDGITQKQTSASKSRSLQRVMVAAYAKYISSCCFCILYIALVDYGAFALTDG